ncbi:acyl-CoA carboxylase subunit epsilon [Streptomyces sp. NBC_01549]|uniref:acyl-CoA carboxylase subunit epsilon n=1 Tax=Streptomyces sp. NBC_01549 TaxID=2975874 RepID=UPI00338DF6A0
MSRKAEAGPRTVRVHRGFPSPEELAALMAVVRIRNSTSSVQPPGPTSKPRLAASWRRPERRQAYADPRAWPGRGNATG